MKKLRWRAIAKAHKKLIRKQKNRFKSIMPFDLGNA